MLAIVLAAILLIWLLLISEGSIRGTPFIAMVGILAAILALVLGLRNAFRGRPWMAATSLALCGCVLLSVPAGFMLWTMLSHWNSQAQSKAEQAELLRRFPSQTIYVPDTSVMPPGTDEGPFFDATPEDEEPRIEQIYHPPDETSDYDPSQITSIHFIQRPDARELVRRCDDEVADDVPGCQVVARTPDGHEIRLKYAPEKLPEEPLSHSYYFVVIGDDAVETDVFTRGAEARSRDFDPVRFVDGLEPVPKEKFLEDPPEGTYWG